jgi:tetratricopeptide (TPR) repeat protein
MTEPSSPRKRPYVPRRGVRPITHRLGERGFEGREILDEYPGLPGYLLWTAFRDAHLWATRTGDGPLFAAAAGHEALIRDLPDEPFGPVRLHLLELLGIPVAPEVDAAAVSSSCLKLALWSEEQSRLATAVEYAQVASFASPHDAMPAVHAARLLKMRAEWARSWSWFDHAIFLSRAHEDWEAYASAYAHLGSMYLERGNLPLARRALRRSLRSAARHHLPERVAFACHNLFAVESVSGNWERAERYVVRALGSYAAGSPNRPRLARDLAYRWMLRGHFNLALPLSVEVLQHFTAPADRALVWSDIARAAAGVGDAETFERAWAEAWLAAERASLEPFTINILLNLAHGAAFRSDLPRARLTATKALSLASSRREAQSILEAEALLDSLPGDDEEVSRPKDRSPTAEIVADAFLRTLREERAAL